MEILILDLVQKYPLATGILSILYIFGMVNKPFFAFLHSLANATENNKDNAMLDAVESSRAYKWLAFVLDWAVRIKLPVKK